MKEYKLKGVALRDYNDTQKKLRVEKDEEVIEERGRYEELFSNGFVSEGTMVEEKTSKKLIDKIKGEE